jgi:diketogulonate reductase-like aldo/keto reductase
VLKPECWSELSGCGAVSYNATLLYIQTAWAMGERNIRIDNGLSYENVKSVGQAIRDSGVPRANIALIVKAGNPSAMGYADITAQVRQGLLDSGVAYYDNVYVHWPTSTAHSQEPACNAGAAYNATFCRLESWRALVDLFKGGFCKAIGVSNYDAAQMAEIVNTYDASLWPSINQIPIHLYRSSSQMQSALYAQRHGITVNAYSPLGVPDWHVYPAPMSPTELQDPLVLALAAKYARSPAQVLINFLWQLGITSNPRTRSAPHMVENLNAFDFALTDGEVNTLLASPQDWCTVDKGDYECAPAS